MSSIKFTDNSAACIGLLENTVNIFLEEVGQLIQGQAAMNSRVGKGHENDIDNSGHLKGSWKYVIDDDAGKVTIGSPLENAIWEEFGTGEYALYDNGRKGGWSYCDDEGEWHHTYGKTPQRALHNAIETTKPAIKAQMIKVMGNMKK